MNATALRAPRKVTQATNVVRLTLAHDSGAKDKEDTIRCLERLLAAARSGRLIGVSYTAIDKDKEFYYSSCGYAHRNPAWAAAMSSTLHYGTMRRVFGED